VLSPALAEALAGLFSRYGAAGAVSDYGWTVYRRARRPAIAKPVGRRRRRGRPDGSAARPTRTLGRGPASAGMPDRLLLRTGVAVAAGADVAALAGHRPSEALAVAVIAEQGGAAMAGRTSIAIEGERFLINGQPTYAGRVYRGWPVEGLLLNSRMVQAIFDDLNPETRARWAYPDTGCWDPERNVNEFIAQLPEYRRHGLLAVTVNLQGGSPEGYSKTQPWENSAFEPDGALRPAYLDRLRRVLDRLDELGMVAIVGLFYFGQDERLRDEAAVRRAVDNAAGWLLDQGYTNVILEINNECDVPRYEHAILQPPRVHELIEQAQALTRGGRRLLVGTSYRGRSVPGERVIAVSDLALLHGNGVTDPAFIGEMVTRTRALPTYRPMPIVFNEDDHFDFDRPANNLLTAIAHYASWGYFDPGAGAGGSAARGNYVDGYQLVPVNWGINTERKRSFFGLVREITGGAG
jgi:hypothetical protein